MMCCAADRGINLICRYSDAEVNLKGSFIAGLAGNHSTKNFTRKLDYNTDKTHSKRELMTRAVSQ